MSTYGEAIVIYRKSSRKAALDSPAVSKLQSLIDSGDKGLHTFDFPGEDRMEIENVVEAIDQETNHVADGGSRVERINEGEREEAVEGSGGPNPRKKVKTRNEQLEEAYLLLYVITPSCLRRIWDLYFDNKKKGEYLHFYTIKHDSPPP